MFADVAGALDRLRTGGWRVAILSNIDDDLIGATIPRLGAPIDLVVTAEQVRSYKPLPGHFEMFRRASGADGAWVHVAQSLFHDIAPAGQLGLPTVWVNREDDRDFGEATVTIPNLDSLPDSRSLTGRGCYCLITKLMSSRGRKRDCRGQTRSSAD